MRHSAEGQSAFAARITMACSHADPVDRQVVGRFHAADPARHVVRSVLLCRVARVCGGQRQAGACEQICTGRSTHC